MIQKLLEQLKQEREYPGSYSKEGWLALDSRLEEFDRRRRRRRALVWWLPFMLLLGLNGWLWQSLYRAHKQQLADINRKVTVIVDTIYQKHTVVITDTVFLSKPYSSPFTDGGLFLHPSGLDRQRRHQIAGNYKESIQDSLAASVLSQRTQTNNGEELAANKPHDLTFIEPLAGRLPARVFSRPQTKKNLDDTSDSDITYVSARRSPVNKELYSGLHLSPLLAQHPGAMPVLGMGFVWRNELNLGMDQLVLWQSLGWQRLALKGNEKRSIPGYPLPPPPAPDAEFESVDYASSNVIAQLGLTWRFELLKDLIPTLGLGIGGNYRFGAVQSSLFEGEEEEEDYRQVRSLYSTGWAGFSGHLEAGLDWQLHRLWRLRLGASYSKMLRQHLPDGNIDQWWGLNAGVFYRLR